MKGILYYKQCDRNIKDYKKYYENLPLQRLRT